MNYFETLQAKLLRGRFFNEADDASKPLVIVINQSLAKKYFPGEDPIGKRIGDTELTPKSMRTIVGTLSTTSGRARLDTETLPAEYQPFNQNTDTYFGDGGADIPGSAATVLPAIDAVIRKIDPGIGTVDESTMLQRMNNSPAAYIHRSAAWLVGGFAALALVLGVVGLYGVIAYSGEPDGRGRLGFALALGAQRASVYQLILKEAGWLTLFGIVVGVACSIGAAISIRELVVWGERVGRFNAGDGRGGTGREFARVLASYFPARRAASVNPTVEALRGRRVTEQAQGTGHEGWGCETTKPRDPCGVGAWSVHFLD